MFDDNTFILAIKDTLEDYFDDDSISLESKKHLTIILCNEIIRVLSL